MASIRALLKSLALRASHAGERPSERQRPSIVVEARAETDSEDESSASASSPSSRPLLSPGHSRSSSLGDSAVPLPPAATGSVDLATARILDQVCGQALPRLQREAGRIFDEASAAALPAVQGTLRIVLQLASRHFGVTRRLDAFFSSARRPHDGLPEGEAAQLRFSSIAGRTAVACAYASKMAKDWLAAGNQLNSIGFKLPAALSSVSGRQEVALRLAQLVHICEEAVQCNQLLLAVWFIDPTALCSAVRAILPQDLVDSAAKCLLHLAFRDGDDWSSPLATLPMQPPTSSVVQQPGVLPALFELLRRASSKTQLGVLEQFTFMAQNHGKQLWLSLVEAITVFVRPDMAVVEMLLPLADGEPVAAPRLERRGVVADHLSKCQLLIVQLMVGPLLSRALHERRRDGLTGEKSLYAVTMGVLAQCTMHFGLLVDDLGLALRETAVALVAHCGANDDSRMLAAQLAEAVMKTLVKRVRLLCPEQEWGMHENMSKLLDAAHELAFELADWRGLAKPHLTMSQRKRARQILARCRRVGFALDSTDDLVDMRLIDAAVVLSDAQVRMLKLMDPAERGEQAISKALARARVAKSKWEQAESLAAPGVSRLAKIRSRAGQDAMRRWLQACKKACSAAGGSHEEELVKVARERARQLAAVVRA